MKSEFTLAFNELAEQNKLDRETIVEALEMALVTAYRKSVNASTAQKVTAKIIPETGEVHVYAEKEVVEVVQDNHTEVQLATAREYDAHADLGDLVQVESTPAGFGRIAAQTAKQVILQRLREAEREKQYLEFAKRLGEIVHGTVQSVNFREAIIGLGRAEAILPRNQQMSSERYRTHEKVRAYVLEVKRSPKGPQIILSRTHKNLLRRLLEMEVPEIYNGTVEIKSIAREPGQRSKVAVAARNQMTIDPVGACVGMRGVRIQSIVRELNDEKIDVIEWNTKQEDFISKALSPARVNGVYLDEDPINGRTATVVVPDDQLSLAIGREGQNARLAAKLTGWRIDIKSLTEAAQDSLAALRKDIALQDLAQELAGDIERVAVILQKRLDKKLVMPEEFTVLNRLVDRCERHFLDLNRAKREMQRDKRSEARVHILKDAFKVQLIDVNTLPERFVDVLREAGFVTVGQVLESFTVEPERISSLPGLQMRDMELLIQQYSLSHEAAVVPSSTSESATALETAEPVQVNPAVVPASSIASVVEPVAEPQPIVQKPEPAPSMEQLVDAEVALDDFFGVVPDDIFLPIPSVVDVVPSEKLDADQPKHTEKKNKKAKKKGHGFTYDEERDVYVPKKGRSTNWDEMDDF